MVYRTKELSKRYSQGLFLAPMVRVGTLPMRLLALEQGADLVWSPEIVDKSIIGSKRVKYSNGVIRYYRGDSVVFSCHEKEKSKLVFQIGTCDPELALKAALIVQQDVSGVDLNCGCPKKFSVASGMGAALLKVPDLLCSILEKLVHNLSVPVTCKIRILESKEQTLELVKKIEATGVSALTVHCRTPDMRSSRKAIWDRLVEITETINDIPVVINGDLYSRSDFENAKKIVKVSSGMVARGVYTNISIFNSSGVTISELEMIKRYIALSMFVDNRYTNTKYTLLKVYSDTKSNIYAKLQKAKSYSDVCEMFKIDFEYCKDYMASFNLVSELLNDDQINLLKNKINGIECRLTNIIEENDYSEIQENDADKLQSQDELDFPNKRNKIDESEA